MRKIDIRAGDRFGRLTIITEAEPHITAKGESVRRCHVACDCGKRLIVRLSNMRHEITRSCGCLHLDIVTTHGQSWGAKQTAEYRAWENMISRCTLPSYRDFRHYGGRGICVCNEWRGSFQAFFDFVGIKPTPQHSLDRINNDGNYEPGNVRWATKSEQSLNQRRYKPAA